MPQAPLALPADDADDLLAGLCADDDPADDAPPLPLDPSRELPFTVQLAVTPRAYQQRGAGRLAAPAAAAAWSCCRPAPARRCVALMALEQLPARTLVVVPTIDLLQQWRAG